MKKRTANLIRLPSELEDRLDALAKLTRYKKNDLQVAAIELLCTFSEAGHQHIALPEVIVGARAIRAHKKDPVIIDFGGKYAEIVEPGGPAKARVAEEDPSSGQARRANER